MQIETLRDRLSPYPKRIDINGCCGIKPDRLIIVTPEKDAWVNKAANEFRDFIKELTGFSPGLAERSPSREKTAIYFLPTDCRMFNELYEHPFFENFSFHPGFQAYRIAPLSGSTGLVVQGLDGEGIYWGMKTLKQLLRMENKTLYLPRMLVADGADMEERGIWSQPFGTTSPWEGREKSLAHYKRWIDWMSDHKLNLFEIMTVGRGGLCYRSKAHPEFNHADVADREYFISELMQYGKERGMRMIPVFSHPELFEYIGKKFPELIPDNSVQHNGIQIKIAVNFFHEGTRRVLQDIAGELMEFLSPGGLCFWMAENSLHSLKPEERAGRSEFMQEALVYSEIVKTLRKGTAGPECRILLSQGSFPENLKIIRAIPPDVKWIYYNGERSGTYNIREKNPIHRDIAAAAAEGHWISLCNALCGIPCRPNHMAAIHRNTVYAVKAGLKGIDGMSFAFPADRMAMEVAGEYSWNSGGRPLADVLRTAAIDEGVKNVDDQVKAYMLYDRANFSQAILNSQGIGQPFGNFSRFSAMLERIKNNEKVDELIMVVADSMETHDIPVLAMAAEDVETALVFADSGADELFRLRCEYLLRLIRVSIKVARAFYVNCREKSWDMHKGAWTDYRNELLLILAGLKSEAEQDSSLYGRLAKMEGWSSSMAGAIGSVKDPLLETAKASGEIDVRKVTSSIETDAKT